MTSPAPHPPSDTRDDERGDDRDSGHGFDRPSKTQLKKDMHELQALGEALVALPDSRVVDLPISESLRDAVAEYKRTRSFEGKRRQMQYIGKLSARTTSNPFAKQWPPCSCGGRQRFARAARSRTLACGAARKR